MALLASSRSCRRSNSRARSGLATGLVRGAVSTAMTTLSAYERCGGVYRNQAFLQRLGETVSVEELFRRNRVGGSTNRGLYRAPRKRRAFDAGGELFDASKNFQSS